MAKEEAPAEEVVEQAPTRMFSTAGLVVMIGANLATAIAVFLVVSMLTAAPEEPLVDNAGGVVDVDTQFLGLSDLTTRVNTSGGKSTNVRYDILVAFEGGAAEQTAAINHFEQGNRDERLRGIASSVMRNYSLEDVQDAAFEKRFEKMLLSEFNKVAESPEKNIKVALVDVTSINWD